MGVPPSPPPRKDSVSGVFDTSPNCIQTTILLGPPAEGRPGPSYDDDYDDEVNTSSLSDAGLCHCDRQKERNLAGDSGLLFIIVSLFDWFAIHYHVTVSLFLMEPGRRFRCILVWHHHHHYHHHHHHCQNHSNNNMARDSVQVHFSFAKPFKISPKHLHSTTIFTNALQAVFSKIITLFPAKIKEVFLLYQYPAGEN